MLSDKEIANIRDGQAYLVDVRSRAEFEAEKSPNAINIDVHDIASGVLPEVPRDAPVFLYCRSGNRAELAKHIMESRGFTKVKNVGGYRDLPAELAK